MKPVVTKWQTEGKLAVIYEVGGLLAFYSYENDPRYKKGQLLTLEEFKMSEPYKVIEFSSGESLPSDAYIDLSFSWSKEKV